MTFKVRKPGSKLLRISTILLLFILKGASPKAAYAFVPSPGMSTLDTCAAQPACRAALGSELAPVIATPTAEGVASTITASTATGVSTTTQAAAGVAVVGDMRLSGIAAYYLWSRGVNGQAQEIARQRYCAAYPTDSVCTPFTGGQSPVYYYVYAVRNGVEYVLHWTDQYDTPLPVLGPITNIVPNGSWGWYSQTYGHKYLVYDANGNLVGNKPLISKEHTFELIGTVPNPPTIARRVDGQPDTLGNPPPLPWKDWPQVKRSIAVAALTPADWLGLINSMPEGGRLNPGDTVNAPGGIIIPGQEEDDPNTPADERLLRKDQGFFTSPPDFDYDREPDESDTDDDDDGTPDSSDPDPQNPLVPEASSDPPSPSPDPSQNPSPTVPGPGVGGNGTASEFGDMSGMSRADADAFLRSLGATIKTTADGYTQYKFPDRAEVWIRPDGEVVRTPAPKYGSDGSRINRGLRLNKDGSLLRTRDEFGNQIPGTHSTGEMVSN